MTYQAIQILLILLPGFFCARIVGALTVRPQAGDFDKIIEALFYSFFVYFFCVAVIGTSPILIEPKAGAYWNAIEFDLQSARRFIISAFATSALLGLVVSYLVTNDVLTRVLRAIKVTKRSSRISVWSDAFHDIDQFVIVEFTDGRRARGWPRLFSDTPDEASLFLEKASWILDDGTPVDIKGAGLLITKNMGIQTVSFVDGQ